MSKFKKNSKASQDIPTAALPDIIFMCYSFYGDNSVKRNGVVGGAEITCCYTT